MGGKTTRFRQRGEDEFYRLAPVEKRSPDSHGSSRKVIRFSTVFGNFLADEDDQGTHEINQIRLARISRVNFQQMQQFGKNISADAAQFAVLDVKELRLLHHSQEDIAAYLVQICAVFVERDALVVRRKIDGEDERLESFANSEWWQ